MPGVGVAPFGSGPRFAGIPGVALPVGGGAEFGLSPSGILAGSIFTVLLFAFAAEFVAEFVGPLDPHPNDSAAKITAVPDTHNFNMFI